MTFADFLTFGRLLMVPFFLGFFLSGEFVVAFWIFTVAGVTDLVDGSIARWMKQQSQFGAFWDPVADKALMMSTVFCLLLAGLIPFWFFLLVFGRDIAILCGLAWMKIGRVNFVLEPVLTSKFGTLSNLCFVILTFLAFLHPSVLFLGRLFDFWATLFLISSTFLILISAGQYTVTGLKLIRSHYGK